MTDLPAVLGTLPGWITSGGVLTLVGLLLRWQVRNRELGQSEDDAGRKADRDEIASLREEMRLMREEMHKQRRECEAEQDELRTQVRRLHEELMGMRKQRTQEQIAAVEAMGPPSPEILSAIKMLRKVP